MGTILSAAMLLRRSLGLHREAAAVEQAVSAAVAAGTLTVDLSPASPASTRAVGDAVVNYVLKAEAQQQIHKTQS